MTTSVSVSGREHSDVRWNLKTEAHVLDVEFLEACNRTSIMTRNWQGYETS